jgi:hypothetical protein
MPSVPSCTSKFVGLYQVYEVAHQKWWVHAKYIFFKKIFFYFFFRCFSTRVMAYSFMRFPDHTQQRTTVGRTPLDEWSACHRNLYLTTHNTHKRQTSMPPVGFEPTISTGERPQTHALDSAVTGTGFPKRYTSHKYITRCEYKSYITFPLDNN